MTSGRDADVTEAFVTRRARWHTPRTRDRYPNDLGGEMADIIQTPGPVNTGGGGRSGAGWAVAVVILLAVIGWLVFGGGLRRTTTYRADVKITPPGQTAPPSGNNGGTGSASGSVAVPPTPPR